MKAQEKEKVIVIGAGAAGLAATAELRRAGVAVELLEARHRIGGRLWTLHPEGVGGTPVDLGPEFLHGAAEEVRELLRGRVLAEISESHSLYWRGTRRPADELLGELPDRLEELRCPEPDEPVAELFTRLQLSEFEEAELRNYFEGFNALDVRQASQCAFRHETALFDDADEVARPHHGYGSLLSSLETRLDPRHAPLHLETRVTRVEWAPGAVTVHAETALGPRSFRGTRAILTLPPSLLAESHSLRLEPELPEKRRSAGFLPVGPVHKVVFALREPAWDLRGAALSFFHSPELSFGTRWIWSVHERPLLTCWSGGSRAESLNGLGREGVIARALIDSAEALGRPLAELEALVEGAYYHDWVSDPFSRGAYAYVRTGGFGSRERLAEPVAGTLFFAGEATAGDGSAGTVHGALRSGMRAACECLRAAGCPS